ncbi:helix-turn-helix transcriptional regulator [Erysipelatoclostridium ramosum]|uniref:Helix-turn-helix transcriptional regulator n=1 Tax=Thomasclavelia ramosa TaxID=1547 RepID=A0AB35IP34_9FIRM|nr:helix-turn-helix transcriptional regulator [Thomasclavelia ramosa]MDB7085827.1 helix-turn-helix transcriptional regulator [Thomasclavelia ramosa]
MKDIGDRIKELRIKKGINQNQLSQLLGVTKSMVSAYETGIRLPSLANIINLSKTFNVTTDYLLGLENDENKSIDLSNLDEIQISHITNLVNYFIEINEWKSSH